MLKIHSRNWNIDSKKSTTSDAVFVLITGGPNYWHSSVSSEDTPELGYLGIPFKLIFMQYFVIINDGVHK